MPLGVTVGPLMPGDVAEAKALLDRCFGAGFGEIDPTDTAFAAHVDGRLVGVITAASRRPADLELHYAGRVSWPGDSPAYPEVTLIRQIGVEQDARGQGVGDALLVAVEDAARSVAPSAAPSAAVGEPPGDHAAYLVANAWVHAHTGRCPAGPLLERAGFAVAGWVPDFFAAMPSEDCPGCGSAPCRCSVRVYFKGPGA